MPHAPALGYKSAQPLTTHGLKDTYMTPRLMPLANMTFSLRGIRSDQMNIQGKMAKKKSQALDQPPSPTLIGWIWMFHVPGVLKGSQLALTGVVWFHNMTVRANEVPAVTVMRTQRAIFCPRS